MLENSPDSSHEVAESELGTRRATYADITHFRGYVEVASRDAWLVAELDAAEMSSGWRCNWRTAHRADASDERRAMKEVDGNGIGPVSDCRGAPEGRSADTGSTFGLTQTMTTCAVTSRTNW